MLVVVFLEWIAPDREDWAMTKGHLTTGLTFVASNAFFQQVVEYLVVVAFYGAVVSLVGQVDSAFGSLAPVTQSLVLIVIVDVLLYGWHVLEHKHPLLWKLHAVHHSSQRYHTLVNSWEHPISAATKALLVILPGLMLGVSKEVITLAYLIKYSHTWLDSREPGPQVRSLAVRSCHDDVSPTTPLGGGRALGFELRVSVHRVGRSVRHTVVAIGRGRNRRWLPRGQESPVS